MGRTVVRVQAADGGGFIELPRDVPARLGACVGDELCIAETPDGLLPTLNEEELSKQMKAAREFDFSAEPRNPTRVYHWLGLTERSVEVPLEGLRTALDRLSAER